MEHWRPVVGMEGFYEVSDLGRVRSLHSIGCKPKCVLTLTKNDKGYLRVGMSCPGRKQFHRVVHRLVIEAFQGPQPSCIHECNHKDGRKQNNRSKNLEWVTPVENNAHAVSNGLWKPHRGEAHGRAKITEADVREIRKLEGKEKTSVVARRFGVSGTAIKLIWRRQNWAHVQ